MTTKTDLPCLDRPGNVFRLSVYKPQRGPAVAVAQEGRVKNEGSYTSFEMELFGSDRTHRVKLTGNNTTKNREAALLRLLEDIETLGWVEKGHSVRVD